MDKKYANYILNKTVEDYNKIGDKYSRVREKGWKEMEFLFEKYLNPGERILDIGCGNGRFYPLFKNKRVEYIGIDNSEKLVRLAREKYLEADFRMASGLELPFNEGYFDKVYSIAVLHHIPSRDFRLRFLEEARRALRPGGCLILTVWDLKEKMKKGLNLWSWFKGRDLDKGDILLPWYGAKDAYFHCFTLKELVQLAKEARFEIKEEGEILVGERPYSNFYIIAQK